MNAGSAPRQPSTGVTRFSRRLLDRWEDTTFGADDAGPHHAPNGVVQDRGEYRAAGLAFYDPGQIQAPVLLIDGEWDRDVPLDVTRAYFVHLTGATDKRGVEIGQAAHMLILDRHRRPAFDAIARLLAERYGHDGTWCESGRGVAWSLFSDGQRNRS